MSWPPALLHLAAFLVRRKSSPAPVEPRLAEFESEAEQIPAPASIPVQQEPKQSRMGSWWKRNTDRITRVWRKLDTWNNDRILRTQQEWREIRLKIWQWVEKSAPPLKLWLKARALKCWVVAKSILASVWAVRRPVGRWLKARTLQCKTKIMPPLVRFRKSTTQHWGYALVAIVGFGFGIAALNSVSSLSVSSINWWWVMLVVGVIAIIVFTWLLVRALSRNRVGRAPGPSGATATTAPGQGTPWFGKLVLVTVVTLIIAATIYEMQTRYIRYKFATPVSAEATYTRPAVIANQSWDALRLPIADCESGLRDANGKAIPGTAHQFEADGSVVTHINTDSSIDFGKWGINSVHNVELEKLKREGHEINIMTEAGNEEFARILYARNGLRDWNSSRDCWESKLSALGITALSDIDRTVTLRPGEPVQAVYRQGQKIDWWGDPTKFDTRWEWDGPDKVRTFTTKPGVDSTELRFHVYPCSDKAPC